PTYPATEHRRTGLEHHAAVEIRGIIDEAVDAPHDGFEDQAVRLEQRCELAGVDPPAVEHLAAHAGTFVDQPLDGIGDLELTARRGLDGGDCFVDGGVEDVHTDQRQVGGGLLWLLQETYY